MNGSADRHQEVAPSHSGDPDLPHYLSHAEQEALLSTSGPSCSLYHGHALSEDFPWEERTPTRYREASSSQDIPLARVRSAQDDGLGSGDTPTASFKHPAAPRASSVALSPEVPFLHRDQSSGPSPSYSVSRRANSMPSPSHQDPTPSAPSTSFPQNRKRARPSVIDNPVSRAQPSRAPKKRKELPDESAEGAPSQISGKGTSSRPRSKPRNVERAKPNRSATQTKWVFDGVHVPPLQDRQLWDAVFDFVPSSPLSSLPPSSPLQEQSQARIRSPFLDDYDTWEATVDPADVRRLQQRSLSPGRSSRLSCV